MYLFLKLLFTQRNLVFCVFIRVNLVLLKCFFLSNFILFCLYLTPDTHKTILFFSVSVIVAGMDALVGTVFAGMRTKFFPTHS